MAHASFDQPPILLHVSLYRFGNSDNAGDFTVDTGHIQPMSLMEFLWSLHTLLSRPRATDLRVDELYQAYHEQFGHECPIAGWLVVESSSGGLMGAVRRIPHVVDLYQVSPDSPWFMRATNPPDLQFTQLREVDDSYKIRLQQIAAGKIPIEDLADSSGVTGMLFGLDRVAACMNIIMGIIKLLSEKSSVTNPMDLGTLGREFYDLYKIELDVFSLINEKSLLQLLLKFRIFFNVFNDGISWKVILCDEEIDFSQVENIVKSVILVQPSNRRVVRLSPLIPLPSAAQAYTEDNEEGGEDLNEDFAQEASAPDSVAALVSILQGFQKQPAPAAATSAPASEVSSVTAQIQQLIQKKKESSTPTTTTGASGTALNELMAALQAAKQNK